MGLRKKKSFIDQASERVSDLSATVKPQLEHALTEARTKAAPVIADARTKAAPMIADARERAVAGLADAREFAVAKAAEVQGKPVKKKKGGKLKKIALFGGVAAAVGLVARKVQGGGTSDNWQSSYVPTPAPAAAASEDAGGAGPDEALADEAETPSAVTTPDDPATVVELDKD